MSTNERPAGYEHDLSEYGACFFDQWCGEPVGWGFKILRHLGDERFGHLGTFGSVEYGGTNWFLIVKRLTRSEAIEKYGDISGEEFGPKGGWRSVTFGEKKFISKCLRPSTEQMQQAQHSSVAKFPEIKPKESGTVRSEIRSKINQAWATVKDLDCQDWDFECCHLGRTQVCVHRATREVLGKLKKLVDKCKTGGVYFRDWDD